MTMPETSFRVRHEPMRIAGEKVDADGVLEVRYPWDDTVVGTVPAGNAGRSPHRPWGDRCASHVP